MGQITLSSVEAAEGKLPPVCLRCGEPADAPILQTFSRFGRGLAVRAPLCPRHRNHWRWRLAVGLVVGLAVAAAGVAVALLAPAGAGLRLTPALAFVVLAPLAWLWLVLVLHESGIHATRVDPQFITLRRVSPKFSAAAGPATPCEPGARLTTGLDRTAVVLGGLFIGMVVVPAAAMILTRRPAPATPPQVALAEPTAEQPEPQPASPERRAAPPESKRESPESKRESPEEKPAASAKKPEPPVPAKEPAKETRADAQPLATFVDRLKAAGGAAESETPKPLPERGEPRPDAEPADDSADVYAKVVKSTVWVLSLRAGSQIASGTGTVVDVKSRLVLTNYHVVGDFKTAAVYFPLFRDGAVVGERAEYEKGSSFVGEVIARDRRKDLALLRLSQVPAWARPIELAAKPASPGQNTHSIGNPGVSSSLWVYTPGKVRSPATKFAWTVKTGDQEFKFEAKVLVTTSPTNPGDSGGPLVNDRGQLIGITQGGNHAAQQFSYFIDLSDIKPFLASPLAEASKPANPSLPLPISTIPRPEGPKPSPAREPAPLPLKR